MTVSAVDNIRRLRSAVSRMNSDSGVVTTMCGGRRTIRSRSHVGVSPVRIAVRISGYGRPPRSASSAISPSGACRFRWMSVLSALSGDT